MKKESSVPSIIGCLIVQLCVGIIYLWSVFSGPVQATFAFSAEAAKMVSSIMLLAFVLGNLVGGFINDKKGAKFAAYLGVILFGLGVGLTGVLNKDTIGLIYGTYCVMGGLGSGIAYGACISCIQKWLPHKRGLASGLAVSAFGFSTVIFSPVSNWLMNAFKTGSVTLASGSDALTVNFTAVFFILAGVFLVLGLVGCTMIRLPSENYISSLNLPAAKAPVNQKNYTLGQAIKTAPFWCLFGSMFFINGTWNLASPIIKTLAVDRGMAESMAVFAVSFTGVTNAAGRLLMSWLSDKIGRVATMIILCVLTIVGALCMTFVTGVPYVIVIAIIAFAYGGPSAIHAAMSTDFFGPKNSGTNYGVIMLALGFSSIFFNWISSSFLKSDPVPTFIMGAITAVVPIIMMLIINRLLKKQKAEAAVNK